MTNRERKVLQSCALYAAVMLLPDVPNCRLELYLTFLRWLFPGFGRLASPMAVCEGRFRARSTLPRDRDKASSRSPVRERELMMSTFGLADAEKF